MRRSRHSSGPNQTAITLLVRNRLIGPSLGGCDVLRLCRDYVSVISDVDPQQRLSGMHVLANIHQPSSYFARNAKTEIPLNARRDHSGKQLTSSLGRLHDHDSPEFRPSSSVPLHMPPATPSSDAVSPNRGSNAS